ncbi:MAG TPA: TerC family protein [Syntrophorhabdales bacterium]|nr:TerC family protein [Syntrophorhabdales bacterium]
MLDWANIWSACHVSFTAGFWLALVSVVVINIILSGDNAVVIALTVRSLTGRQRLQGIILGTGLAVVLRIALTFFCARLLEVSFLKFTGGWLIAWIAVKLFVGGTGDEGARKEVHTLGKAVVTILIADLVMSTDNVLAVAGACKGNMALLLFGLGSSIPLVVFASDILSRLMDRYPIIVTLGAAALGRVAGDMIGSDAFITNTFKPNTFTLYVLQGLFTVGVIVIGKAWIKWKQAMPGASPESDGD